MEKTNELNKFLSYMHMGNTIFRIYLEHAKKLENKKLINLIVEIQEIFKTHEEAMAVLRDMKMNPVILDALDRKYGTKSANGFATGFGMSGTQPAVA